MVPLGEFSLSRMGLPTRKHPFDHQRNTFLSVSPLIDTKGGRITCDSVAQMFLKRCVNGGRNGPELWGTFDLG